MVTSWAYAPPRNSPDWTSADEYSGHRGKYLFTKKRNVAFLRDRNFDLEAFKISSMHGSSRSRPRRHHSVEFLWSCGQEPCDEVCSLPYHNWCGCVKANSRSRFPAISSSRVALPDRANTSGAYPAHRYDSHESLG